MNIVLLIVDSLRKQSIPAPGSATPDFFSMLEGESVSFERAYATECWTLPTHLSMFTGLMPSEHGAHFQTMAYEGKAPTIAELLAERGYATELATRNPVLDGTIPGVARGFSRIELILADYGRGLNPLSMGLALSKPRFRRQIKASGFFTPHQRASRDFLAHLPPRTLRSMGWLRGGLGSVVGSEAPRRGAPRARAAPRPQRRELVGARSRAARTTAPASRAARRGCALPRARSRW